MIHRGERVAIVDDLIATGGTALAAAQLIEQAAGIPPVAAEFVIGLSSLGGSEALQRRKIATASLLTFP
jgi:adenine phosphoribosyltransferase